MTWGAAWLFRATKDAKYLNIANSYGTANAPDIFSWDNKYAGAYVLLSRVTFTGLTLKLHVCQIYFRLFFTAFFEFCFPLQGALLDNDMSLFQFKEAAQNFVCHIIPHSPSSSTQYTQGKRIKNKNDLAWVDNILIEKV